MSVNIKIPDDLAAQIDTVAENRSEFVEEAVRKLLSETATISSQEEIALINRVADQLNEEAAEVLEFQAIP